MSRCLNVSKSYHVVSRAGLSPASAASVVTCTLAARKVDVDPLLKLELPFLLRGFFFLKKKENRNQNKTTNAILKNEKVRLG